MKVAYMFFLAFSTICLQSCKPNKRLEEKILVKNDSAITKSKDRFELEELLTSHLSNKVRLDTFLSKITHQENVKVISKLSEKWDEKKGVYTYSDSNYRFAFKEFSTDFNSNCVFYDSLTKIKFNDYSLTCYSDSIFRCEDYGFKNKKSNFVNPTIVETCGKRFFYSNLSYWCNGIGCGCFVTFVYDLDSHKPTFIENYRIPFDGYFISDFDNDNNPDLLVISQTIEEKMKGFDFDEFLVKLSAYSYKNGFFKMSIDNQFQRPYCYDLYSFTSIFNHSYHDGFTYSVTNDNWFRPQQK